MSGSHLKGQLLVNLDGDLHQGSQARLGDGWCKLGGLSSAQKCCPGALQDGRLGSPAWTVQRAVAGSCSVRLAHWQHLNQAEYTAAVVTLGLLFGPVRRVAATLAEHSWCLHCRAADNQLFSMGACIAA